MDFLNLKLLLVIKVLIVKDLYFYRVSFDFFFYDVLVYASINGVERGD